MATGLSSDHHQGRAERTVAFYKKVLGLKVRYEDDFAVSLDSGGVELRLQNVERFTPQSFTTLGRPVPAGEELNRAD